MKKVLFLILIFRLVLFSDCGKCDSLKCYVDSAVLRTDSGNIRFTFFEKEAPNHVENFKKLVKTGFYEGKFFHRVIPDFIIQAGRDTATAYSSIDSEINKIHFKGALAAARQNNDINPARRSDGFEFYICLKPLPDLDGKYTVFGRTAEGFETVQKIAASQRDESDRPLKDIFIKSAYLETYFDSERFDYLRRMSENK